MGVRRVHVCANDFACMQPYGLTSRVEGGKNKLTLRRCTVQVIMLARFLSFEVMVSSAMSNSCGISPQFTVSGVGILKLLLQYNSSVFCIIDNSG